MVVSEMGEQWSPHTAPAMQAEMHDDAPVGLSMGKTFCTMGIRMPKVPQLVPVAKARHAADQEHDGRQEASAGPRHCSYTKSRTKYLAPRESVMAFRVQAKVRIRMAGTMALKPSGMQAIISLKDMDRRTQ